MFIATVSYVTRSGYKKTVSFAHDEECIVNEWLTSKLNQLTRLKCTNFAGAYVAA